MVNYTITGEKQRISNALVDYVADGYIERNGENIPCEIGFTEFYSDDLSESVEIEPTHIFIKDGITDNGTHYEAETIVI